jgi:hypothetical protein
MTLNLKWSKVTLKNYASKFSWLTLQTIILVTNIFSFIDFTHCRRCELKVQVSLVIRGGYVLSIWTANLEFADIKFIFD